MQVLSQLSYGPVSCKILYPVPGTPTWHPYLAIVERDHGGPGKTRTSDLTLIKRAL